MKVNEELHIPDRINVGQFIDRLFERYIIDFQKDLLSMYKGNFPSWGTSLTKIYQLSDIPNSIDWLDGRTKFKFECIILNNVPNKTEFTKYANFSKSPNTDAYIEYSNDGVPYKMFGAEFDITYFLLDSNKFNSSKDINEESIIEIKESLRHEISHAYKELFEHSMFDVKINDKICVDSTQKSSDFLSSYQNLANSLYTNDDDKLESEFVFMLYSLCYKERDAFISGFYQRLINDIKLNGKPNDINAYYEYNVYKKNITIIDNLDESFYKKYKTDIINLFGKRSGKKSQCKSILLSICTETINKLQNIYYYVLNTNNNKNELKVKENEYIKYKDSLFESMSTNVDNDSRTIYKVYYDFYMNNPIDGLIESFSKIFNIK